MVSKYIHQVQIGETLLDGRTLLYVHGRENPQEYGFDDGSWWRLDDMTDCTERGFIGRPFGTVIRLSEPGHEEAPAV